MGLPAVARGPENATLPLKVTPSGRSPGAGNGSGVRGRCRYQHMTAVSPGPHAQYRRTRT